MTAPYLYLLMRNDLASMNYGKMMAHAAHAANLFTHSTTFGNTIKASVIRAEYDRWLLSANGFGTTISLSVSMREMELVITQATSGGFLAQSVVDPTYPYILHREYANLISHPEDHPPSPLGDGMMMCIREETTCGYVFGDKDQLRPIVGHLPMVK